MRSDRWRTLQALLAACALLLLMLPGPAQANHGDCVVDLTPETDSNPLGQDHTVVAALRPAGTDVDGSSTASCPDHGNVTINFEVEGDAGADYDDADIDPGDSGNNDMSCTIGNNNNSCSVTYARTVVTGTDDIRGTIGDDASVSDTVTKTWTAASASFLNVTPESDTNPLRSSHTLTATVRNANGGTTSGVVVDFEVTAGPNEDLDGDPNEPDRSCTTGSNGTCSVSYNDADADSGQSDTICGWIDTDTDDVFDDGGSGSDGGDCDSESTGESEDSSVSGNDSFGNDVTDKVTKTWSSSGTSGAAVFLNVTPENDTNALRSSHSVTATARDADGDLVRNAVIDLEVIDGPNEDVDSDSDGVDRTCTTSNQGSCSLSYTDASADSGERDEICVWIDGDTDDSFDNGGSDNDGGDCEDESAGESEDSSDSGTDTFGSDQTDIVLKSWGSGAVSGTAIYLNLVPEEDENQLRDEHEITAVARNSNGNLISGADVDLEIIDGPNEDLESDADMECTTGSDGTCEVSYDDENANVGDQDEICGWLDTNDDDDFDDEGSRNDGGDCDSEDPDETEDSARSGNDLFGNDDTDVVTKDWEASSNAFYLNVTPEQSAGSTRTQHTLNASATTDEGDPAEGVSIDFEIVRGPNQNLDGQSGNADLECVTDGSGDCSVSYTDQDASEGSADVICGWLDIEDDDDFATNGGISDGGACDDEIVGEPEDSAEPGNDTFGNDATDTVRRRWGAQQGAPAVCQREDAIVGTDDAETLVGTPGNDVICGLGGGDSILGEGGNDLIVGGGGADNIRGGAGSDSIRGGKGKDTAVGQGGSDDLRGGEGSDYLLGSASNDIIRGGDGDDVLDGGRNLDVCRGGDGRDRLLKCEG